MNKTNKDKARRHTARFWSIPEYKDITNRAIHNSVIYTGGTDTAPKKAKARYNRTIQSVDNVDVFESIVYCRTYPDEFGKVAVCNFSSYKRPGGGFMDGSYAQEERLCHASNLYNVLSARMEFYEYNTRKENMKDGLYTDRCLYSPGITFMTPGDEDIVCLCDVITCAAPNAGRYTKYWEKENLGSTAERDKNIYNTLYDRIKFIFDVAAENKVDTLIFGAYGCGVFKCDPVDVASICNELIKGEYKGVFRKVIYAIHSKTPYNYNTFKHIIKES